MDESLLERMRYYLCAMPIPPCEGVWVLPSNEKPPVAGACWMVVVAAGVLVAAGPNKEPPAPRA